MAKGLPWVGSSGKTANPRDQYAPKAGSYDPGPVSRADQTKDSNEQHASLSKDFGQGETMRKGRS